MLFVALICLTAVAPAVAIWRFVLLQLGRTPFPGEMDRRPSQVGATVAFMGALALLISSVGFDVSGRLSVVRLPIAGWGVLVYFLASIWWLWAWAWPIRPPAARWWIIWAPAAPWIFVLLSGLTAALHPVELPRYMVVAIYTLISALGVSPIALTTIWLRVGPDAAGDVTQDTR